MQYPELCKTMLILMTDEVRILILSSTLPEVNTVLPWKCLGIYIHYNYPWNWKTANLSVNVDC